MESWIDFVKKFTVPEKIDENIWKVNDYPMLVINLEVNLNFKRKKEKTKHKKEKVPDGEEDAAKDVE